MGKDKEILVKFVDGIRDIADKTYGDSLRRLALQLDDVKNERDRLYDENIILRHVIVEDASDGRYIPKLNTACTNWDVEDVLSRAEDMNQYISETVAEQILYLMKKNYDKDVGITWKKIDDLFDYYTDNKNKFHG